MRTPRDGGGGGGGAASVGQEEGRLEVEKKKRRAVGDGGGGSSWSGSGRGKGQGRGKWRLEVGGMPVVMRARIEEEECPKGRVDGGVGGVPRGGQKEGSGGRWMRDSIHRRWMR